MTQSLEERQQICRNDKQFSLETEFLREYSSEEPDMTDMGYVVYKRCVDAETPVLTGDLKWVPAGELDKGDEIIGFDEEPVDTGRSSQRYFRAGEVTSNHIEPAETMGIELEDGRTLYATPDHEWLVKFDSSKTEVQWRETQDLESTKKGSDVYLQEHFGKPWSSEQTYEEGYIAGAYDGEGNLDKLSGLNFTQVDNAMKQKMEDILSDENIEYTQTVKNASQENPNRQDCFDMRFHGFTDIARLLGRTQPERLVEKFMKNLRHGNTQSDYGQRLRCDPENLVKVENVFDAGERDIAMLSTDVSTHFTGGFASHNTYARRLGNGETEEWWQTVKRVVEGVYTVQKRHYDTQGLDWNEDEKRTEARQMYEKIFNFKFTPPGRGLWAMGTDYIFDRETSAPLFNCAFVSTENIQDDFTQPFCYMMDMSMLGVGVGFDTRGKGEMTIKEPEETDETYVVPDSREGWVESVRTLLEGYAYGDEIPGEFDYSEIRDEGEPLEGFGGTSSGAGPLTQLHENIHKLLSPVVGEEIDAPTIVDLMNLIGKCVVAGNIRRSAQICIGEPHNEDYLSLKDPDEQTDFWGEDENEHHRWAANLSVNAEVGMDYSAPAERTAKNGEPGYIWLENGRDNARMGHNDMPEDGEVLGTNPCAEILLAHGEKCNLSETYPSNHDNLEEWQETLRFAYVYAKTVTLLPNHNDLTDRQIRDKRRLGVSISGIIQAFNKHGRRKMLNEMEAGYEYLQELDEAVSDMWNVCESIRLTSVKPSGTVSRLADVTSGIHYPEAPHYTRNIRFNENSDVLDQLREAGYPTEPDKYSDNSTVVSFPMKKENIEKAKYDVSMWEQLENAAQVAEHWADNAVSITVTYDPETEADDIEDALELYEHRLKTVSFLPAEKGVYDQAPYIPISEGEFKQNKEETGELDLSGDTSEKIEKFCQGDKCEIDLSQVDDE